jgi:hypothetical protein
MGDSREFLDKYVKVRKTIGSCTTLRHTEVAQQMVENLNMSCDHNSLPYDFYASYLTQLKSLLKEKIDELS